MNLRRNLGVGLEPTTIGVKVRFSANWNTPEGMVSDGLEPPADRFTVCSLNHSGNDTSINNISISL